ncbi:MAG: tyrosine-type recombinase/integrase [Thermodesulfobacteriota bacterium]
MHPQDIAGFAQRTDNGKMTHPDIGFWRHRVWMWQGEARGGEDDQDGAVQFYTRRPPRLWQEHQADQSGDRPFRVWWIEWYQDGQRKRERIGPNKTAAEQRLREVLSARTEGRHIRKSLDSRTLFKSLAAWYLDLPEVKAKRSYKKDQMHCKRLMAKFGDRLLKDITPSMVESYKQERLYAISCRNKTTKPATVNRELTTLKTIFNKAVRDNKAEKNPAQGVKAFKENNARDRILSPDEYVRLLTHCPTHLKPVVKLAYQTAMRRGEILGLSWGQIDLKEGFIKLRAEDCKTNEGRLVPLNSELIEMFEAMPRGLPMTPVFTYQGHSMAEMKRSFATACKRAGIEDFTFHDLRHTAINNWRLQGHDFFRIMAASGHKTMNVFKRYNTVSKDELKALVGEKI